MNLALESTQCFFDVYGTLLSTDTESGWCHSGTLGEIEIFKMAAKMAAANKNNIKTAITSLLIDLGMYFLAPIVCLVLQGIDRICPICIQCCKSKMAAKMSAANMKHYNNHKQTHLSIAYRRKNSLSVLHTRGITPSKQFSHHTVRRHHCHCPRLLR